ncbi:MAG TPA: hypothetical protein VLT33_19090 [Labilithrix sp.]|nr:hypothetical protein [Labilithrix sp.]
MLLSLPLMLLACSTFGSDDASSSGSTPPGEDAGIDAVDGTPVDELLSLVPLAKGPVFVIQGASVEVPLTILRGKNVPDPITVTVEGLPTGVAPALLQFGIGETKAKLSIQAAGDATQALVQAKVRVTSGKITSTTPLELFVRGAPGALDTTFGDNGFVAKAIGDGKDNSARDLQLLADDSLIVVGDSSSLNACIAKYSRDGKRDATFGTAGVARLQTLANAGAAAVTATGKLVIAGGAGLKFDTISLQRLNSDGSFDQSFGTNGICDSVAGLIANPVTGLSVRPKDGAIFAQFHYRVAGGAVAMGLLKKGANCEAQPTFGTSGNAPVSWSTKTFPLGLTLRADRPVLIGRSAVDPTNYGIAQVDGDTGALDAAFGTNGTMSWTTASKPDADTGSHSGIALLPTGAVVANIPLQTGFVIASIEPDGKTLSPNFGTAGTVAINYGNPTDLVRQSDGKLLVNIASAVSDVRRLNANGSSDMTFGSGGQYVDNRFRGQRVKQQQDGRIILFGEVGAFGDHDISLVRLWN